MSLTHDEREALIAHAASTSDDPLESACYQILMDQGEAENEIAELQSDLATARKREMRWIPVSERLPERGTSVLVIQDKFRPAFTGMMLEDGDWIEDGEGFQIDVPAYWMPLPPAPEQDERGKG